MSFRPCTGCPLQNWSIYRDPPTEDPKIGFAHLSLTLPIKKIKLTAFYFPRCSWFTLKVLLSEIEIYLPSICLNNCAEYSPGLTILPDDSFLKFISEIVDWDSEDKFQLALDNPFLFFAFTSIAANYSYAESNLLYISKKKRVMILFRLAMIAMVMFGAISKVELVWTLADSALGIMTLINLSALLLLSRHAEELHLFVS